MMRRGLFRLLAITGLLAATCPYLTLPAHAGCVDYADQIRFIGHYQTISPANALDLSEGVCYVGVADIGLVALDWSDPTETIELGMHFFDNEYAWVRDVAVVGARAYCALGSPGLEIVDVSDPTNMYRFYRLDSPGSARAVRLRGEYAYVANGISLQIARVLNVIEPVWVGAVAAHDYIAGVAIQGSLAYVIDGGELRIFDLTDPVSPDEIGSVFVPQHPDYTETIAVFGTLAFVCGYGLDVVDVSIPTSPVVRGSLTNQYVHEVVASGSTLYVAHDTRGIVVLDISDPDNLAEIGRSPSFIGSGFRLDGDIGYAAGSAAGVWALDLSTLSSHEPYSTHPLVDQPHGIALRSSLAYIANADQGLVIADLADPFHPELVSTTPTPGTALDVTLFGNYAFVGDGGSGLRSIDVSDPANPVVRGGVSGNLASEIAVVGTVAYMIQEGYALTLIDVSDPANPQLLERITDAPGYCVTMQDDYAYVGGYGVLRVVDVSGPPPHSVVSTLPLTDYLVHSVHAEGPVLFATAGDGLYSIDISNPAVPTSLGYLGTGLSGMDLALCGSIAYVAARAAGLQVYDVSDPSDPQWVGGIATPEHAWDVAFDDEMVVITDGITYTGNTLQILPLHCLAAAIKTPGPRGRHPILWVSPNPVRAAADVFYLLERAGPVRLDVFGVDGRCHRSLEAGEIQCAGMHRLGWDGADKSGHPMSPGVYWLRLDSAGNVETRRFVVLR